MIKRFIIFALLTATAIASLDRDIITPDNLGVVVHRSASDNVVTTPGPIDGSSDGSICYWLGTQMAWSDPLKLNWDDGTDTLLATIITDGTATLTSGDLTNLTSIQWDLTTVDTPAEGLMYWNDDDSTLNLGMPGGNVNLQIGQEMLLPRKVKNTSGSDMVNGDLVYISGGDGVNAYVTLAKADAETTSIGTIAMLTEDIANNQFGFATTLGLVRGETAQPIDTSSWSPGTMLYLSAATGGASTNTRPVAPNHGVSIGVVFRQHATEGIVLVRIINGFQIDELHDVLITGVANNEVLTYNSATPAWENTSTITGITLNGGWTLANGGTWTGISILDCSDNRKTIELADNNALALSIQANGAYIGIVTTDGSEKINIGSNTLNQKVNFLTTDITNMAGPLEVDQIGPNDNTDPLLIQLATGQVDINGDLTLKHSGFPTLKLDRGGENSNYTKIWNQNDVITNLDHIAAAGIARFRMNPLALDGTSAAVIEFFRNTNTSGPVDFDIFKGDGSGTVTFCVDAKTGDTLVAGLTKTEGGKIVNTTRITGNTTLDATHHHVFCDTDGGAIIVTLPAGVDGTTYRIINAGSNDVTVAPDGVELIEGLNESQAFAKGVVILTYETTEGWY